MMKILILGASGFVGRHLLAGLQAAGHDCWRGVRQATGSRDVAVDYCTDTDVARWLPRVQGFDAVINAVGILRDSRSEPMQQVLGAAPAALFRACQQAGVPRVVSISALGIEGPLQTPYFLHRRSAEAVLFASAEPLRWLNLRPSVIYGEDGASAKLFRLLAALPVHGLPGGGTQTLQPVHIDDVVAAVQRWLGDPEATSQCVNAAGAEPTTLRGMLDSFREQRGKSPALHLHVPAGLVRIGARCGDFVPFSPLCTDTLTMLNAGNVGDNRRFAALLGRAPRSFRSFLRDAA
jgi:nucleoside-diphosphate-sugar epimerase